MQQHACCVHDYFIILTQWSGRGLGLSLASLHRPACCRFRQFECWWTLERPSSHVIFLARWKARRQAGHRLHSHRSRTVSCLGGRRGGFSASATCSWRSIWLGQSWSDRHYCGRFDWGWFASWSQRELWLLHPHTNFLSSWFWLGFVTCCYRHNCQFWRLLFA